MKTEKKPQQQDKGTKNIIQRKKGNSFVKPVGDTSKFSPPSTSGKQHKSLPGKLQSNMESSLGHDFSNVGIHTNSQKAVQMNARAFTQNEQVHFAPGEFNPSSSKGQNLIGHEFTHIAQQRAGVVKPTKTLKKGVMVNDDRSLESEADSFGKKAVRGEAVSKYRSAGLGMRDSMRTSQMMPNVIQRDIKGDKQLGYGKMEVDFVKNDAAAAGGMARETGEVRFHPDIGTPHSNAIRLIQVVRMVDTAGSSTTAGDPWKFTDANNQFRNDNTTADRANNVAGGFHVDILPGSATPRTNKADAEVLPYYNAHAGGVTGVKNKTTETTATLWDSPGHSGPIKYNFVTSAKTQDTGRWLGTALWGFEIFLDGGKAKIKDEYHSFREYRGETTDAALEEFDNHFNNPGTPGAP